MKIITELITPFNKKEIDYVSFNKFIETNNNDYILIFSNVRHRFLDVTFRLSHSYFSIIRSNCFINPEFGFDTLIM